MKNKKPKKKHLPIDKSKLEFGMPVKIEDSKYRASFLFNKCLICGDIQSTVGAHIRTGYFGIGKPSDDLLHPLCYYHHNTEQHEGKHGEERKMGEAAFYKKYMGWTIDQAKDAARQRYKDWRHRMWLKARD